MESGILDNKNHYSSKSLITFSNVDLSYFNKFKLKREKYFVRERTPYILTIEINSTITFTFLTKHLVWGSLVYRLHGNC